MSRYLQAAGPQEYRIRPREQSSRPQKIYKKHQCFFELPHHIRKEENRIFPRILSICLRLGNRCKWVQSYPLQLKLRRLGHQSCLLYAQARVKKDAVQEHNWSTYADGGCWFHAQIKNDKIEELDHLHGQYRWIVRWVCQTSW